MRDCVCFEIEVNGLYMDHVWEKVLNILTTSDLHAPSRIPSAISTTAMNFLQLAYVSPW